MHPSQALALHRARIRQIASSHRVKDIRVFGSALRGDDVEGSGLDLLVEPTPNTTLFDIGAIRFELKQLLGLQVDVVTPDSLPDNFRDRVLKEPSPYESRRGYRECAITLQVKGVIPWVAAAEALQAEVRLYDRLFSMPQPARAERIFWTN